MYSRAGGIFMNTYVRPSLTLKHAEAFQRSEFMYFIWFSEQTVIISPYSINLLVFITKTEWVYCAVRSAS